MSAVREAVVPRLSEQAWKQLSDLESLHRAVQQSHERVIRTLDQAALSTHRSELQVAWNQYRAVVADLGRVTEDIESLRLTLR
jgi:acetolactate synthase small subunit